MKVLALAFVSCLLFQPGQGPEKNLDPREIVLGLSNKLSHRDAKTRQKAAIELGRVGIALRVSLAQLSAVLTNDRDPLVREQAAIALANIGPSANVVVPSLIKALDDENENV